MAIRLEVQPDLSIEIQRPQPRGNSHFIYCRDLVGAMRITRFLLKRDLALAERDKFVPQFMKDARQAFKQLSKESPYNGKEKAGGPPGPGE